MGGQILGDRYQVERQLGKKAGRWTLKAQDIQTASPVILKILFLDDGLDATDLRLFKREVDTLKLLKHEATPRYLGYFEMAMPTNDQAMVLVQSYVDGVSLQTYLGQSRTFGEVEVREIARQTLEILDTLHSHEPPIIHRDIRPSNLLLQPGLPVATARVCLVDFGTVKALSASTTAITMIGTDGYLPPEQSAGRVLATSDLYSLGATLAEALTGQSPLKMRTKGLRIHFEDFVDATPDFVAWLKQLLSPSLENRWQSAQDALVALNQLA
ncbi:serine/threonine-protein kinase [Halomicronema sp. CCY15110]|uniref:serine/threonine protein kinase n=1 Tax=Halomicronema sp. CCY15110 TaxID=2767773 RepID=UPI0019523A25|nr:serine/threonine-protein kinase [Halomicronema sp. CCY15110]